MLRPASKSPYSTKMKIVNTILDAASKGEHVMIESPTGSGKSLAPINTARRWLLANPTSKVYYCSRTHQQLDQIPNTVRQVDDKIRTVRLMGNCLCKNPTGPGNMPRVCNGVKISSLTP